MHSPIVETLLQIVHVITSVFLILVVLLQQGKGGGLGAAFGGGATAQVFGGRGAGNVLTRATAISASIFMLTSVTLAYISSSGDRALKERAKVEEASKKAKANVKREEPAKASDNAASDKAPAAPVDKAPQGPEGNVEGTPQNAPSEKTETKTPAP